MTFNGFADNVFDSQNQLLEALSDLCFAANQNYLSVHHKPLGKTSGDLNGVYLRMSRLKLRRVVDI